MSPQPAVQIRPVRLADAPRIAALAGQLGYPMSPQPASARLAPLLESEADQVFVAEATGALAGWLHAQQRPGLITPPSAEILALVVDETQRRRGAGRALVRAAVEWARDRGARQLRVRTNLRRVDAPLFYQQLGFTETKRQVVFDLDLAAKAPRQGSPQE